MKLSAPIHVLKQQAKALSRRDKIRLHAALDRIAVREGFQAWSHLAARWQPEDASAAVFSELRGGDLLLLAARRGQGKTLLGIGLALEAMVHGHCAAFFTLEFTAAEATRHFQALQKTPRDFGPLLLVDDSEHISAPYIAARLAAAPPRTLVVIDYLQVLDHRRDTPALGEQLRLLHRFAVERQAIVVCLSQLRRGDAPASAPFPGLDDVRLPNPADLSLFSKSCFLHGGQARLVVHRH